MSMTFCCWEAPRKVVPCWYCEHYKSTSPDLLVDGKCDRFCPGTEEVSEAPELNLSNDSALGILGLLGLPRQDGGTVEAQEVPDVLRKVIRALNVEADRQGLVREGYDERAHEARIERDAETGLPTISTGCRVVSFGTTDEQTVRQLTVLRELLVYAADRGLPVGWG